MGRIVAVLATGVAVGAFAPGAAAAVVIGDVDPNSGSNCSGPTAMVQSTPAAGKTYTSPVDGVITSFRFQGPGSIPPPSETKLLVLEQLSPTDYRVVAASQFESVLGFLVSRATRVPIATGQMIGSYGHSCFTDTPSNGGMFRQAQFVPEPAVGSVQTYGGINPGRMILEATIEPDADGDGFGDETQDQCPTEPSLQEAPCDRVAPNATITKQPKDKTKKKKATFEFTSNEPGSTFTCALDGKEQFKPCTSPLTVKVKKGKHTFAVRAIDQAGNVDPTPATDGWKVKKKKKK